ncbi:sulfurtransferase-like selenium metabolism protein YedF [candidate division TA06 bacterium]|uniref:Sulfurtransferase-like selenium metabolism protein YedF n=1 Tax=candidate division TA06 bacterium TaxID=2250710 RepID=A0A523UPK7_UNCT6|nr:MAG: sulfurtransferase-like selenium metabolism protein YedF [candidate division TA06 bacterium]
MVLGLFTRRSGEWRAERMNVGNVVFLNKDRIGHGEDELGKILMKAFLTNVLAVEPLPTHIAFMNSGVKLTVSGSEVLDILKEMEKKNVGLLVCGTCLDYFRIKDKLGVGKVSNQNEIVKTFTAASKVITV